MTSTRTATTIAPPRPDRARLRTIELDGSAVRLEVRSLTIRRFDRIAALAYPRGSTPAVDAAAEVYLRRCTAINDYVRPAGRDIVDAETGDVVTRLGEWFGGQPDAGERLFGALLSAQQPDKAERRALEVAARFTEWLGTRKKGSSAPFAETGTDCGKCHEQKLCASRGCDGTQQKKVVWFDKKLVLRTCPVLAFTPETERALRVFHWTHDVGADGRWHQVTLPSAGGLRDQDAWTTGAMGLLRSVYAAMASERRKAAADE